MGYDIKKIKKIKAELTRKLKAGTSKADVIVNMDSKKERISIKKYSASFNQIDKRWADNYVSLWEIPSNTLNALKKYSGEKGFQPSDFLDDSEVAKLKDSRRFFMDELPINEKKSIIDFFTKKLNQVVSDLLKGRGENCADWLLVVKYDDNNSIETSKIIPIDKAIDYYSQGGISISSKGVIKIGKITLQRKGGDAGRKTAQMLQFKFSPNDVLNL